MIMVALWRTAAGTRSGTAEDEGFEGKTTDRGRDKSACPKRHKPLTRLAFWRACGSVAGMKPGFCEEFQGARVHAAEQAAPGAVR